MCRIIFIFILVALFVACSDKSTEPVDLGYSGITITDDTGLVLSVDDDDWCYLHDTIKTETNPAAKIIPLSYSFYAAYPNPCNTVVYIQFGLPVISSVDIKFVSNERDTVFKYNKSLEAGYYELMVDVQPAPAGLYRCFMNAGDFSCYGDIQVRH